MVFKRLLEPDIRAFIEEHEYSDVHDLALKKAPDSDWPWALVLDQIKARQKATVKVPLWASHHRDIVFPRADIMEQASSAATARYKAKLVKGKTFADLTGGAGVDCCALTEHFESGICIDRDPEASALIAHNIKLLSPGSVEVRTEDAEAFVRDMEPVDLVIIDPQRRSEQRKGLFRLADCAPDITALVPDLKGRTGKVIIKTSPMLDIAQAINDLGPVCEVHILQWRGECREVVYVLDFGAAINPEDVPYTAVILDDGGEILSSLTFTRAEESNGEAQTGAPEEFLYEPGPAFQKAGAFNTLALRFGLKKLHKHTHLYTGAALKADFPGRRFRIIGVLPVDRKALPFDKANLTIRNFPGDIATLRKTLKLREGGDEYLFACTLADERKVLIHGHKIA